VTVEARRVGKSDTLPALESRRELHKIALPGVDSSSGGKLWPRRLTANDGEGAGGGGVVGHVVLSGVIAAGLLVLMGMQSTDDDLGLPPHWAWILTTLQVCSLGLIGRRSAAGWLLGASVQASWIYYAMLTDQAGFIAGAALSLVIHVRSYFIRCDNGRTQ
jgi:hypothetical protein